MSSGALLIAGKPLGEPIAQHALFVMNARQELKQTVNDFKQGRLACHYIFSSILSIYDVGKSSIYVAFSLGRVGHR